MEKEIEKGELLFSQGKIEEAERYFKDLLRRDPGNPELHNNLGVIALHCGNSELALEHLTRALELDPLNRDALINYSTMLKSSNRLPDCIPLLENLIRHNPHDLEIIEILQEAERSKKSSPKIAILCLPGLESFLTDIVEFLKTKYAVQTCYSKDKSEIEAAVNWSDIIWLEWANELAVAITNASHLIEGKRVICRLHSYEVFTNFINEINWSSIGNLIFVSEKVRDIAIKRNPKISEKVKNIHLIPNGVPLAKFPMVERKKTKNIAYLGYVNYKKGGQLLMHAFKAIHDHDPGYKLYIAGEIQDLRYVYYYEEFISSNRLQGSIFFDGWVDDVNSWLRDKAYIISTSLFESHPVGVMEAMATGVKPLIHNFPGAKDIYPKEYVWNDIEDLVRMVRSTAYSPNKYRKYIEENFSLELQISKIQDLISAITPSQIGDKCDATFGAMKQPVVL